MARKSLNETYDVAIIGGGIVGSGIFRDLSLHNKSALIIDKHDFNSQTSAGSSKMLHGGIRYLENLDFLLVYEALHEKNLWLKLAPHIVKESPFYLPVYKESKWPLFFLKLGLFLYDLLSLFRNTPHKTFNKQGTLRILPGLKSENLRGSGMYFDSIVDDHKLGLECIYDGLINETCQALNYHEVISIEKNDELYQVTIKDLMENQTKVINAKNVISATGPFTDQFMKKMNIPWEPIILPSKGSHLWLHKNSLAITTPMVLQTKDNRIIFVVPQRNAILVGTTETPLNEDDHFSNLTPSEDEINYLLGEVNTYFPEANVTHDDLLASFAAVRPLVKDGHKSAKVSRKHMIYKPQDNFYVIAGGKYTTFRKMAEDLNDKLFKDMNWPYDKSLSKNPLRRISIIDDPHHHPITQELLTEIMQEESVRTDEDLVLRRLSLPSLEFLSSKQKQKTILNFISETIRKSK